MVWPDELGDPMLTIPHGEGVDRAEGMTLVPSAIPPSVLIVYDAPSATRKVNDRAVRADIFGLP